MSEAAGMFGQSEEPTHPMRVKVHLIVECVVEADPEFFDTSEATLKVVAQVVLSNAMDEYAERWDGNRMEFDCLAGKVVMKTPRVIRDDDRWGVVDDGIEGVRIAFKGSEFCELEGRIDG